VKSIHQDPVAVARVEGTKAYKSLMRMGATPASTEAVKYSTWCPLYHNWTPQSVKNHLGYCQGDPEVDAMSDMLRKLQVAAEAQLGHAICLVDISLSDREAAKGRLEQILDAAMANLGLTQAFDWKSNDMALVLYNEGWFDLDYDKLEVVFLTVESDYTGTINIDLSLMEEGVMETIRRHYNITGTTLPVQCHERTVPTMPKTCETPMYQRRVAIRKALKAVTRPPFDDSNRETLPSLSKITVHGNAAHETVLHEELRAAFDSYLPASSIAKNPTYSSTLGGATRAFRDINGPWFRRDPPQWCCLRSRGKGCPDREHVDI
jgi:hypothetical protein